MREVSIAADGPAAARAALESCIARGGVAVFPADTLYGLASDAQNGAATERIYALKGREEGKPAAVMFFAPLAMRELVATLGPRTRDALGTLLPGAVTLVVHNPGHRYPLACREDPERLGIRLIEGPLAGARCAILQTSANLSGAPAPASFAEIAPEIIAGADLAIDGGELRGEPSTVVDLTGLDAGGAWRILREGAVSASEIRERLDAGRGQQGGSPGPSAGGQGR